MCLVIINMYYYSYYYYNIIIRSIIIIYYLFIVYYYYYFLLFIDVIVNLKASTVIVLQTQSGSPPHAAAFVFKTQRRDSPRLQVHKCGMKIRCHRSKLDDNEAVLQPSAQVGIFRAQAC